MTGKADFTEEEWHTLLEAPVSAGLIVVTAQRGGTFRESFAMAKAYAEARQQHGGSQLLDEIVAAKPQRDKTHYHSHDEQKTAGLKHLQDAVAILGQKAAPEDIEGYKQFVLTLAGKVAHAHREHGQEVSPAEQAALDEIAATLGTSSSGA
jgi:hypothetical protein